MNAQGFLRLRLGWTGAVAALAGLLAAACLQLQRASMLDEEREKLRFLSSEIAKLERDTHELDVLRPEIDALLARRQAVEAVQRPRLQGARLMQEIASRRPDGVALSALAFAEGEALVRGSASSEKAVQDFADALGSSSHLALAGKPKASGGAAWQFTLRIRLRPEPRS